MTTDSRKVHVDTQHLYDVNQVSRVVGVGGAAIVGTVIWADRQCERYYIL